MKNITLIGCGAVGALYGLRLHNLLGREHVCFLVDETRRQRYESDDIILNGQRAPFRYCTPEEAKPADLIILATKNHHLEDAIGLMRSSIGPDTAILSLLNGIESEQILAAEFGQEKVLYSFAVGLNSTHTGNAITYTAEGRIVFGEKDNKVSRRVTAIADLFEKAGISYLVPEDIQLEMWNKFMLNTTYNTISSLLYATYADFDQSAVLGTRAGSFDLQGSADGGSEGRSTASRLPDRAEPQNRLQPRFGGEDIHVSGYGGWKEN